MCHLPSLVLTLPQLLCLLLPPSTLGLGDRGDNTTCPRYCSCTTLPGKDVMWKYLTKYVPFIVSDFQEIVQGLIERIASSFVAEIIDIRCHVPDRERVNLTDLLPAKVFSKQALRITCGPQSSMVWDLSASDVFIVILDISGCNLEKAAVMETVAVPPYVIVLYINDVPAKSLQHLDMSACKIFIAISITNTGLTSLPFKWPRTPQSTMVLIRLAHNKLKNFTCELKIGLVLFLVLDHNDLTAVPPCVLVGNFRIYYISLRHNSIQTLQGLLANEQEDPKTTIAVFAYLDVGYNQLESLPPLRYSYFNGFDVSHNRLRSIAPNAFAPITTLSQLDLSNNQLEHVPDGALTSLVNLRHLNLSHNRLRSFTFDQSPVTKGIPTLDLRHNNLTYPPFADTGFVAPRLSRIRAAHNPFTCDCPLNGFLDFLRMLNSSRRESWYGSGFYFTNDDPSLIQPYVDVHDFRCSQPADLKGVRLDSLYFRKACPLLDGCPAECRCELRTGERQHVSVNCSQSQALTELPAELPLVPNVSLVLNVNRSGLKRLDYRPYLRQVSEIHGANSQVSSVSAGAMEALQNIGVLRLDNNRLTSLPAVTQNLTLAAATTISLDNNPWTCGCQDLWMSRWLEEHVDTLTDVNSVQCQLTGKLVIKLRPSDLSCGVFNYLPLVITLSSLLALAVVLASLLVKYKLEVLVFLYTRFRLRPFDMFRYDQAQDMRFDVFVSFSRHDYQWVVEQLVGHLENGVRPYSLCIHLRDFPVGEPIADNIAWAVSNSRCTLLLLTRNFLASEWCRHEFRTAHRRLLNDRHAKLLIVVHGPLEVRRLDRELKAYLRTNTYLATEDPRFLDKLHYALPPPHQDPQEGVGDDGGGVVVNDGGGENGAHPPLAIEMDVIRPEAREERVAPPEI